MGLLFSGVGLAQDAPPRDLTEASLEDLMNVRITSVSKKEQSLSRTGAAIYVITQDDIHRSGASNIPDLLRMVPGVNVARVDANAWAISIRGFNTRYSDKALVLIDGRSVYTASFSGVYWDQQDVPLEDIERIEVIRGPGGTVWGANAMNGVINIITRSSQATKGGVISAEAGSEETAQGLVQYGGQAGDKGTYRAFGRYFGVQSSIKPDGSDGGDAWRGAHGGFRSDWTLSRADTLMVAGDLFHTSEGQTLTMIADNNLPNPETFHDGIDVSTGDIVGRWDHKLRNGSDTTLQVYYDHLYRLDEGLTEIADTASADFQHHTAWGSRQDIVWGLGYRAMRDYLSPGFDITWSPARKTDRLYSTFFQDEIQVAKGLWFTFGSKFEHNDYSGFEFEPSAQLVWSPTAHQTFWASAGKAIRQPSRQDNAIDYNVGIVPLQGSAFGVVQVIGSPQVEAEELRDMEGGYRAQINKRWSLDVSIFRSYYRDLETAEPGDPFFVGAPQPPHLVFPLILSNKARATSYGGEASATWTVNNRWRISPGYSLLHLWIVEDPLSQDSTASAAMGDSPKHQIFLRTSYDLTHNLQWTTSLYFVGLLSEDLIPAYTRLDTHLSWRIGEFTEFSVTGQNLLTPRHFEFADAFEVDHTQVERSVLAKITWRF